MLVSSASFCFICVSEILAKLLVSRQCLVVHSGNEGSFRCHVGVLWVAILLAGRSKSIVEFVLVVVVFLLLLPRALDTTVAHVVLACLLGGMKEGLACLLAC